MACRGVNGEAVRVKGLLCYFLGGVTLAKLLDYKVNATDNFGSVMLGTFGALATFTGKAIATLQSAGCGYNEVIRRAVVFCM